LAEESLIYTCFAALYTWLEASAVYTFVMTTLMTFTDQKHFSKN
jgi:hypothetical protein